MGKLKEDLSEIPSWVWLGAAAAGALLFLITHLGGGSGSSSASAVPDTSGVDAGTPVGPSSSTASGVDPVQQFLQELQTLQAMNNPAPGPAPTSPQGTTGNPTDPDGGGGYVPLQISLGGGLLPTTSPPTQAGIDTAHQALENALGVYGGAPVSQSNPFAGQNLGSTWDDVTQTIYQGGGVVTDLGIAQPAPAPGQGVPPAVQNTPSSNPYSGYTYSYGFQPGQTQQGSGSALDVLAQEVAAGVITQAQADQSRKNMGL